MVRKPLELDLGEKTEDARNFARVNPEITLSEFLNVYEARFPEGQVPSQENLRLPISSFILQPIQLAKSIKSQAGGGPRIRAALDGLWQEEVEGSARSRSEPASSVDPDPLPNDDLGSYQDVISDNEAVRFAYRLEMDAIADFLRTNLSVLVVCDKMLTEFIYEFVCNQAGKSIVLDSSLPTDNKQRGVLGSQLDQAMQGGNPLANLPVLIHNLKPGEVLALRSLDMLDNPAMIELLYQRNARGEKPQFIAFLDPSLEIKKVLADRFAVHISIMGLPRYVAVDGERLYTVTRLLTREERERFRSYDAEALYKNVAGLNAIQFRNAMQYVGAKVARGTEPSEIYRMIRQFKISSSDEIEIPDTTFEDIGGYQPVKQQLQRIITLLAGPIRGLGEKQRQQLIPRGFIFHGPPGTGKTLFAKAIANEMNATIQMVSGPEIMDKYVGQSENNLRRIFATARRNAPAVVFFDEFDSLASQRSAYADGGTRANNAVVAQFLTELDGFRQDQTVLIIGTTNRIDIIDEALLRPSRLRPIEIALPDFAARQHVAAIHARNFGIETLLKELFSLASQHCEKWEKTGADDGKRKIPEEFLDVLFERHEPYKLRYEIEDQQASFLRELRKFFSFVRDCRRESGEHTQSNVLDQLTERLGAIGMRYGMSLNEDIPFDASTRESEDWMLPMRIDIRDLFAILEHELNRDSKLTAEAFVTTIMDLVAEYTVNFNNDEIRAVFQEASLENHMEGRLITPRYLGQKIGMIRKRRDEREAVHLSSQIGRR